MEERIESTEENQKSPYQYRNFNYENSSESQQIQNSSSNEVIDTEATRKYIKKVHKTSSKYATLSEDEIQDLIETRNENLLKINTEKEKTKKELSKLIVKLNDTISTNADILYEQSSDTDVIDN